MSAPCKRPPGSARSCGPRIGEHGATSHRAGSHAAKWACGLPRARRSTVSRTRRSVPLRRTSGRPIRPRMSLHPWTSNGDTTAHATANTFMHRSGGLQTTSCVSRPSKSRVFQGGDLRHHPASPVLQSSRRRALSGEHAVMQDGAVRRPRASLDRLSSSTRMNMSSSPVMLGIQSGCADRWLGATRPTRCSSLAGRSGMGAGYSVRRL